jgi:hypothetical protein
MSECIPEQFIKNQIDTLLGMANKFGPLTPMGQACMHRAEYYMDLVKAYKESKTNA